MPFQRVSTHFEMSKEIALEWKTSSGYVQIKFPATSEFLKVLLDNIPNVSSAPTRQIGGSREGESSRRTPGICERNKKRI